MKLALAGVGRIGTVHARTLVGVDGVKELVLADVDGARARAVAGSLVEQHPGVSALSGVADLFSCGADGLVIAASTGSHTSLLLRGIEAGIPVFCEKPVATDVEGTLAVLRAVEAAGSIQVQIGFQRRFDTGYVAAREAVVSGVLGWVHTVRSSTLDSAPPPAAYLPTSGGIFRDCSVHDFDIIRWVTGREAVEVYAAGANHGADFIRAAGDVDAAAALVTLDDGSFAHVAAGRYNGRGYDVRMEVLGSRDSLAVGLDDRMPLRSVQPGASFPGGTPYADFMERFAAAYVAELEHFAAVVAGHATTRCTVADALEAFYLAEAAVLSRREHRPVRIEEVRR